MGLITKWESRRESPLVVASPGFPRAEKGKEVGECCRDVGRKKEREPAKGDLHGKPHYGRIRRTRGSKSSGRSRGPAVSFTSKSCKEPEDVYAWDWRDIQKLVPFL